MGRAVYFVGDVHGHLDKLLRVLKTARLLDDRGDFAAGNPEGAELWFTGDLMDRGPDGVGALELVMRLERQAAEIGSRVGMVLGNHDVLLLAVLAFGRSAAGGKTLGFERDWRLMGGRESDLRRVTGRHEEWLLDRPSMALVHGDLLCHADSEMYLQYGGSLPEVNAAIRKILESSDPLEWALLLDRFADRMTFFREPRRAREFVSRFGARRLIHGHTPISRMSGVVASETAGPWVYADGLCVNVDGGLYLGGAGFVWRGDGQGSAAGAGSR